MKGLSSQVIANGLQQPVLLTAPVSDSTRLFVVELTGAIRIIHHGVLLPTPFLNVAPLLGTLDGEEGLLGLAFHPDYATNRTFFITYTDTGGAVVLARYFGSETSPDSADQQSAKILLRVPQPTTIHHSGMVTFGPLDGMLYVSFGDGSLVDMYGYAQNSETWLGKILRFAWIDDTLAVPPDNPFVDSVGTLPEIWGIGFRNPWRWSFDRATGHAYIADVGQDRYEELSVIPAGTRGFNCGWSIREGMHCYNPIENCDTAGLIDPVYEYPHSEGRCSITGGYVYRGCMMPELHGAYFWADFCTGQVMSGRYEGGAFTGITDRTIELDIPPISISGFGEDAAGELYVLSIYGYVFKIVPSGYGEVCGPCCTGTRGNIATASSTNADLADLLRMIDFLFFGDSYTWCIDEANVDMDPNNIIDMSDVAVIIDYLFFGAALPSCP